MVDASRDLAIRWQMTDIVQDSEGCRHGNDPAIQDTRWLGPVFIVGMPRSGTKLLRTLLNQHSDIGIPENESHFIPYYYRRLGGFGDLRDRINFDKFFQTISKSTFFCRLIERGKDISPDEWYQAVGCWDYGGVLKALYQLLARNEGKNVWGDKTPQYLTQLDLLWSIFPDARVIHIIRDARDYCLSMKRAWGKAMLRSAQRWADDVRLCREIGQELGGRSVISKCAMRIYWKIRGIRCK